MIISSAVVSRLRNVRNGSILRAAATRTSPLSISVPESPKLCKLMQSYSTLRSPRGSNGMGLPIDMSHWTIDTIVATAPVLAPHASDVAKNFYRRVLKSRPKLLEFFDPAHNVPIGPKALAASMVTYADNANNLSPLLAPGGLAEAICHRHCALAIPPKRYVQVHANLMASVDEVLGDAVTPEISAAWSEALLFLAKACIDKEEYLYEMSEQRAGGWSGFTEFTVTDMVDVTSEVKQISFMPSLGSPLEGTRHFEFKPGQYLTLKIEIDDDCCIGTRHYMCTAPPDQDFLQCAVKKLPGGKVSSFIHEHLKVGDTVKLTPPYGVFTPDTDSIDSSSVLLSAGIGVTPMLNIHRALGHEKVKLVVHVDRAPDMHPYKEYFDGCGSKTMYKYTDVQTFDGSMNCPSAAEIVSETIVQAGDSVDHDFYVCGPDDWMDNVRAELLERGATKVKCEVFSSQLATDYSFKALGLL